MNMDTERLVKLLGMLGSSHDGEVAAAGRKAHALIKKHGITWHDIIRVNGSASGSKESDAAWEQPEAADPEYRKMATTCVNLGAQIMNDWEMEFIESIEEQSGYKKISQKQITILKRIFAKVMQQHQYNKGNTKDDE